MLDVQASNILLGNPDASPVRSNVALKDEASCELRSWQADWLCKCSGAKVLSELWRLLMKSAGSALLVKTGTRFHGHCPTKARIASLTGMIARRAHSPSSPAPPARRFAAVGLDRSARPSKSRPPCYNAFCCDAVRTEGWNFIRRRPTGRVLVFSAHVHGDPRRG